MGCSPWGREESDTTERLHFHFASSFTKMEITRICLMFLASQLLYVSESLLVDLCISWKRKMQSPLQGLLLHLNTATAAKSLQSCLTLCDPMDGSPPGSAVPGILQA